MRFSKSGLGLSSNLKSSEMPLVFFALYLMLVVVTDSLRHMLREGFLGSCSPCFPQYFTNAIFEGLRQQIWPWVVVFLCKTVLVALFMAKIMKVFTV